MGSWHAFERYLLDYRKLGRESFLEEYPHPVLVFTTPEGASSSEDQTQTETLTGGRINLASQLSSAELERISKTEGWRILELYPEKSETERILLGRSKSCDVLVPHRSVSKTHAFFTPLSNGRVTINDAGSRNGTRLNGSKLRPEWEATLEVGDKITFGNITCTFQSADAFAVLISVVLIGR